MEWNKRLKGRFQKLCSKMFHREETRGKNSTITTRIETEHKSVTWTIENYHACPKKVDEYVESPVFHTGFTEVSNWCLRLYPKGRRNALNVESEELFQTDAIGLFLCKLPPSTKNNVSVALSCVTNDGEYLGFRNTNHVCEDPEEIGTDKFVDSCKIQDKEALVISCCMDVGYIDKTKVSENDLTGYTVTSCSLSSDFQKLYESGTFTDVTLQVDNKQFPVHKAVLAARSPVFAAMFERDVEKDLFTIKNIKPSDLDSILQYIYTGKIDATTVQRAIQLYPLADMHELAQLKEECIAVMLRDLSVDVVCPIAVMADTYTVPELENATNYFFRNYSSRIFCREDWDSLCQENPRVASKIFVAVMSDFKTVGSAPK